MADCQVKVVMVRNVEVGGEKFGCRIDCVAYEKCDKVEVKEGEDDRMGTWVSHLIKR